MLYGSSITTRPNKQLRSQEEQEKGAAELSGVVSGQHRTSKSMQLGKAFW